MRAERVVVALGGNAIAQPGNAGPEAQQAAVTGAMEHVADLVGAGYEVAITHGNGPQVGNLLLKNELARDVVPPVGLDWCVAQTQATIGYLITTALERSLARRGLERAIAVLITRVLVDADDPAFESPSKPPSRECSRPAAWAPRWRHACGSSTPAASARRSARSTASRTPWPDAPGRSCGREAAE